MCGDRVFVVVTCVVIVFVILEVGDFRQGRLVVLGANCCVG